MVNENINEQEIIFILGIMPRSGTHFLWNLLCLHPDCEKSAVPEDGLVSKSDFLARYVNLNCHVWQSEGDLPAIPAKELLMESIGEGLKIFLRRAKIEADKLTTDPVVMQANYLVTKFPQVTNIDKFFRLFPHEKLLILVRDGRHLVESINVSFRYNREEAIRDWARAVRRVAAFEKKWAGAKEQYHLVKYEELYTDTEPEMRKILHFLGLDPEKYDFNAALNLPVVGSSVFQRGGGNVHWTPVNKTKEFNPLAGTAGWTRKQHERFNWLAKKELLLFGYAPREFTGNRLGWSLWNRLQDTGYEIRVWWRRLKNLFWFAGRRLRNYFKRKGS